MDLERINVALRPRGEWEAIDLGLRLTQRHAGTLYAAWFLSSAPLALLLGLIFMHFGNPIWAYLLFWLLKPLFDRVLLHLHGRLIFDDRPAPGELRRIALRMPFQAAWLRAITWGRLDPLRSFTLPVFQLEGLRGAARSRRAGVLGLGAGGAAIMLTLGAFASVVLLYLALFSLVMSFLLTDLVSFDAFSIVRHVVEIVETVSESGPALAWSSFLIYYLCEGLIAPLYVGGGFCLYLNRRTHIEAWDVELQFRRAVKRRGLLAPSLALVAIVAGSGFGAQPAFARDDAADPAAGARSEMREAIAEILEDPMFGRTVKRKVWRSKDRDEDEEQRRIEDGPEREPSLLSRLFGSLTEIVLWSLVLVGLVALVVSRQRWLPWLRGEAGERDTKGRGSTRGLLLEDDELPADLVAQVRALWQADRPRAAAALLWRGTLTILNERHALKILDSDTEGDCLRRVRAGSDQRTARYFARLTAAWQRLAYAHRSLTEAELEELCAQFGATLGSRP